MGTTDEPEKILAVLNNILDAGKPAKNGKTSYELGDIAMLPEKAERIILNVLKDEGIISRLEIRPSGSLIFNQGEDKMSDPILQNNNHFSLEPDQSFSISVNKPSVAVFIVDKKKLEKKITTIKKSSNKSKMLLIKDENGDFSIKDKFLMIGGKPLSRDALHYKVLDILYENGDQNGKVELSIMQKELLKQDKNPEYQDSDKLKKAVDNAILNLFRRTKIGLGQLKKTLPNRKRMIDTYEERNRFAGWILNNPTK